MKAWWIDSRGRDVCFGRGEVPGHCSIGFVTTRIEARRGQEKMNQELFLWDTG